MLNKLFKTFSQDLAIDLGTANSLVYVKGQGIVISEPSVVAINQRTGRLLAIGNEAKKMVGRTPAHIVATRPLVQGVISDFEVAEQMLRYFIEKAYKKRFILAPRPRVVIGIPCGVTEVEKKAVRDATMNAGARDVYLIEQPVAAALGAQLQIQEAGGNFIVDVGGGTTEIAVISLGGLVISKSLRIAGDRLNEDIINFSREECKLLIGERTAEELKIRIGSAHILNQLNEEARVRVDKNKTNKDKTNKDKKQSSAKISEKLEMPMRGRNLITGLPEEIIISNYDISKAMEKSIKQIIGNIKATIEETPPELLADIMSNGIYLAGGGSLIKNLDILINKETKIPCKIIDDPLTAVVRGAGMVSEDIDELSNVLLNMEDLEPPK
ncbi:MAG: rod shape-determining protein [Patescibacteria group bacterium]|nr:rod shape-determining protein [Patescibacteria group bacterium]